MARTGIIGQLQGGHRSTAFLVKQGKGVYSPRIVPNGTNNRILNDLDTIYDLAAQPGFKVVLVENTETMTFLGVGLTLMAFHHLKSGKATLGLATGGTWEPGRYVLGMQDFCKAHFGMALPVDKIAGVGTLDDYAYPKPIYDAVAAMVGSEAFFKSEKVLPWSYKGEQLTWLSRLGIPPELFVSPPQQYTYSASQAARRFRQELDEVIRPTLVQFHGEGTDGHDAFNEPVDDPAILLSMTPAEKERALLVDMPTRFVVTTGLTKLQNCFAFIPPLASPEEQKLHDSIVVLRNIGGAYRLLSIESILTKARQIRASGIKPSELDYIPDNKWTYYMDHLEEIIERALNVIAVMPTGAFTQGISDLRESCGVQSSGFDLILACGGHKRESVLHSIEGKIDPRWPASAFQAYYNPIVIVEKQAAGYLSNTADYFIYSAGALPDFTSAGIDARFWGKPMPQAK